MHRVTVVPLLPCGALALKLEGGGVAEPGVLSRYSLLPEPHGTPVLWLSSLL